LAEVAAGSSSPSSSSAAAAAVGAAVGAAVAVAAATAAAADIPRVLPFDFKVSRAQKGAGNLFSTALTAFLRRVTIETASRHFPTVSAVFDMI
jgi:hypothetical protein